jgi:hypothetical protein
MYSPKIGESRWVKGMPVIVARDDIEGLNHGETYYIAGLTKDSLFLSKPDGTRIEVTENEVTKHLDPAFVVTAARLREGIGAADKLFGVAPGLDGQQLDYLAAGDSEVEIVVPDPDVTGALAWVRGMDHVMMDHLKRDSGTGWESRSALDMLAWREGEEVGLGGLQAEIASTTRVIDEVNSRTPREVLIRDIERERIALRDRLKDLTEKVRSAENEADRTDSQNGIERIGRDLKVADERYQIAIGDLADAAPPVVSEIVRSVAFHTQDVEHLIEIEKLLHHFVQARVTAAAKFPKPYHPQLSTDPNLSAEAAYAQLQSQVVAVEEFRVKWGVRDYDSALGTDELEAGQQRDHYDRVARLLAQDAGPGYVHTYSR